MTIKMHRVCSVYLRISNDRLNEWTVHKYRSESNDRHIHLSLSLSLQIISSLKILQRTDVEVDKFDKDKWSVLLTPLLNLWKKVNQVNLSSFPHEGSADEWHSSRILIWSKWNCNHRWKTDLYLRFNRFFSWNATMAFNWCRKSMRISRHSRKSFEASVWSPMKFKNSPRIYSKTKWVEENVRSSARVAFARINLYNINTCPFDHLWATKYVFTPTML